MFPRPKLDAALEARRLEREEATRQAKANLSKRQKTGFAQRTPSSTQLAASGGDMVVEGQIRDAVHGLLQACTCVHKFSELATNTLLLGLLCGWQGAAPGQLQQLQVAAAVRQQQQAVRRQRQNGRASW